MNTPRSAPLTVYYDGACPVCRREIALYRRQPGAEQLCWVDAAQCEPQALGPDLSREAALARLHVRDSQGRLVSGARGFLALWQGLPHWAWLGRLLSHGPLPALLELGYRLFLRLRLLWRRRPVEAVVTAPICDAPSPPALGHRRPPPGQRPEARRSADHV